MLNTRVVGPATGVMLLLCLLSGIQPGPRAAGTVTLTIDDTASRMLISGVGVDEPIPAQSAVLGRAPGQNTFALLEYLILPPANLAFGKSIAIVHEHPTIAVFDPITGDIDISVTLKVIDERGLNEEIAVTLTTGEINADCEDGGSFFCFPGFPGNGSYCEGTAWNSMTGDVRLVAFIQVPTASSSQIGSRCIVLEIDGTITPGDMDSDGDDDLVDNCPATPNGTQDDTDGDGVGDMCDNCLAFPNTDQGDFDGDMLGDICDPFKINFQPRESTLPAGYALDCGEPFDPVKGYGWDGVITLQCRDRGVDPDQVLDTFCFSGGLRRFEIELDPGDYDITVAVGDPSFQQGPQDVFVEGEAFIDDVTTSAGGHVTVTDRVYLRDGRLTVDIGGADGTTVLNKLSIVWVAEADRPAQLHAFNYQPDAVPVPRGFIAAPGDVDTDVTRRGWDIPVETRDRDLIADQVFDTFAFDAAAAYETEVPNGCYVVQACAGDPLFPQGPHFVAAEGQPVIDGDTTLVNEFVCGFYPVSVTDGRLTVEVGDGVATTTINYLTAVTTPVDVDLDGFDNCIDVCPVLYNLDQTDTDGDGFGDVCDEDDDGDDALDDLDCAPLDVEVFAIPVTVNGVLVTGGATSMVAWASQAATTGSATEYNLLTGTLSDLLADRDFSAGTCNPALPETPFEDMTVPAIGDGIYYVLEASNLCGAGGYGDSGQVPDPRELIACP